jgi:hypothetical protein
VGPVVNDHQISPRPITTRVRLAISPAARAKQGGVRRLLVEEIELAEPD